MLTAIVLVFIVGYAAIVFEEKLKISKTATALVTGVVCWTIYAIGKSDIQAVESQLLTSFSNAAEILFFLLGAMTIVEIIDAHDGFDVLISRVKTRRKRSLLWLVGFGAFFLSAVLDNLTTTIVMVSFLRKLISDREDRLFMSAIVVVAANAGGAFSPIGDVTTTMLWIGGQVTTSKLLEYVFLPSLACLVAPLVVVTLKMKGDFLSPTFRRGAFRDNDPSVLDVKLFVSKKHKLFVFVIGIIALLFVPVFKTLTHLPPFMGMMLSLGMMWILTEILHRRKEDEDRIPFTAAHALRQIDTPSILFFAGILLAVGALESTEILRGLAAWLTQIVGNQFVVAVLIGLVSAVVDNVPLVAASMGMYSVEQFPADSPFWHLIAYCTGTGGSLLIIGSAAGVAAMGMERISFFWYVRRISFIAAIGYFSGVAVFFLEHFVF